MDEKFVRKFLKGSFSSTFGSFATLFIHFLTISILSRYVSKEILGLYFLILAIANAAKILSSLGLDLTLVHFLASEVKEIQEQAFSTIIWTRVLATVLLGAVIYGGASFILMQFDSQLITYQVHLIFLFALMSFRELFFYILQGLRQFRNYALAQGLSAILKFCLVVIFRDTLGLNSLLLIELTMLVASLALLLAIVPIKKLSPPRFLFQLSLIPKIFQYGLPLYTSSLLTNVSDFGGTYIVGIFLSPVSIAAYEISKKIPDGFRRLFSSFHNVYFPNLSVLFAQKDLKSAGKLLNNCLCFLAVGAFGLTLFSLLFSRELISLVFSDAYLDVQPTFIIIMLAVCLQLLSTTMGYSLVSAGHPSYATRVNILAMSVEFGLSLVLVPIVGYLGVGIAYVTMSLISQIMCYLYLRKAGVYIDLLIYIRPYLILALCSLIYSALGDAGLGFRFLILLAYPLLSFAFIPSCRQGISYFWNVAQTKKLNAESI